MSLLLATAVVAAAPAAACSWNDPGHNPYRGTIAAAVDRYTDIPAPVRERLKARMAVHRYDEMAAIRRDSITGRATYAPELRDMHFGAGQVCRTVDRSRWTDAMVERGLVYCEDNHCLIVPTVCRNVSRVTRLSPAQEVKAGATEDAAAPGGTRATVASAGVPATMAPETPGAESASGTTDAETPTTVADNPQSFDELRTPGTGLMVTEIPGTETPTPNLGGGLLPPVGDRNPTLEPITLGGLGNIEVPVRPPIDGGNGITPPSPPPPRPPVDPDRPTGILGPEVPWPFPTITDGGEITSPIPEPGTLALMLAGVAAILGWRRRRPR
jgi:hypothetical protein